VTVLWQTDCGERSNYNSRSPGNERLTPACAGVDETASEQNVADACLGVIRATAKLLLLLLLLQLLRGESGFRKVIAYLNRWQQGSHEQSQSSLLKYATFFLVKIVIFAEMK